MLNIGVIGYGHRIHSIVNLLVQTGEVKFVSVMDIDNEAAGSMERRKREGYF